MDYADLFEEQTGTPEDYDPDGDRETGFFSKAWWEKYAQFLESKLTAAQKKAEAPGTIDNTAMLQLLSDIKSYIQNNRRPLKLRKRLISELNAVIAQQQHS